VPPNRVPQAEIRARAAALFGAAFGAASERLLGVFDSSGIEARHFCEPVEWYLRPHGFGEVNERYIAHALDLAEAATRSALERAGLGAAEVDHIVFVSATGVATPSLDARLANRLPLRGDARRTPLWGLGCAGGAVGLARAADFARADPGARVLLVAVELCSLTFQRADLDRRNLVASALFADGAAAVVVAGADAPSAKGRPGTLEVLGSRSTLWPDTLDVMGWEVDDGGFHVVFSRDIPTIVRERVRPAVEAALASVGLSLGDLRHVMAHPGGPKVLQAYAETLGLPRATFRHADAVLRDFGNMSSPTCLFVLARALEAGDVLPGEPALLGALGPGFASESVVLRGAAA